MKKEDLLNDDFLKQFTSSEELNDFLSALQKRGIEKMLEGELDTHLGYEKNQKSTNANSRNGYSQKNIRTSYGESRIQVPRDRDASFNPMLIPKRESMTDGIENVIVSLYAKGMSNSDIEDQIREVYGFDVATSTISRITVTSSRIMYRSKVANPDYFFLFECTHWEACLPMHCAV